MENGDEHGGLLRGEAPRTGGADEVRHGRSPLGLKKAPHQLHHDHIVGWSHDVEVARPIGHTRWDTCLGPPRASKAPGVPTEGAVVSAGQGNSPGSACVSRRKLPNRAKPALSAGLPPPLTHDNKILSCVRSEEGAVATGSWLLAQSSRLEDVCAGAPWIGRSGAKWWGPRLKCQRTPCFSVVGL